MTPLTREDLMVVVLQRARIYVQLEHNPHARLLDELDTSQLEEALRHETDLRGLLAADSKEFATRLAHLLKGDDR